VTATPTHRRRAIAVTALGSLALLATVTRDSRAQSWDGVVVAQGQAMFYMEGGQKRSIEPPATPECLGATPVTVEPGTIDAIPLGPPKTDCARAPHAVSLFDYTFAMPGQPALQHMHAVVRMDDTGKVGGSISYQNKDYLSPFCGAIVAGVYTAEGTLLQEFASPVECVRARSSSGKDADVVATRNVQWLVQLRADLVTRAQILDVRAVSTKGVKVITPQEARAALEKSINVVSEY